MSEEKDTWLKMKPYLIFVAVLANFSCHGVSGAAFDRPSEEDNPMADGARFLPDLPEGQSLGQSGSYSAPITPSNAKFQFLMDKLDKFKDSLGSLFGTDDMDEDAWNEDVSYTIEMAAVLSRNPRNR